MRNKDAGKSKSNEGPAKNNAREFINDPNLKGKSDTERLNGKIQERASKARRTASKTIYKAARLSRANDRTD
jgi:uncharacterized protein YjbJ (UPF0337 family)